MQQKIEDNSSEISALQRKIRELEVRTVLTVIRNDMIVPMSRPK